MDAEKKVVGASLVSRRSRYLYGRTYSDEILREAKRLLEKQRKEHEPLIKEFKRRQQLKTAQLER